MFQMRQRFWEFFIFCTNFLNKPNFCMQIILVLEKLVQEKFLRLCSSKLLSIELKELGNLVGMDNFGLFGVWQFFLQDAKA